MIQRNRLASALATAVVLATSALTVSCGPEGGSSTGAQSPANVQGGSAASAPDFELPATDGSTVRLSDYLGKSVILIDFWSTICDPCMVEMPHLIDMYKAHKDKGFVVLAISLDGPESLAEVKRVVHDKGMVFPVLLDQETVVAARYNPKREMPFAVLIDKSGKIIMKRPGYTPGYEKAVAAAVEKALQ